MDRKIITEATATDIVSLANMRNYLEFTAVDTTEDALITTLLKAAVRMCEDFTGEAFGTKTVEVQVAHDELDEDWRVDLPYYPFDEMSSVKSVDVESTETALTLNTDYYLNGLEKKSIRFMTISTIVGAEKFKGWYKVRYSAGYNGTNTEPIPELYKFAIMEQVKRWYEREFTGKLDKEIVIMLQQTARNVMI